MGGRTDDNKSRPPIQYSLSLFFRPDILWINSRPSSSCLPSYAYRLRANERLGFGATLRQAASERAMYTDWQPWEVILSIGVFPNFPLGCCLICYSKLWLCFSFGLLSERSDMPIRFIYYFPQRFISLSPL